MRTASSGAPTATPPAAQHAGHPVGVVHVHLAAEGLDIERAAGPGRCVGGTRGVFERDSPVQRFQANVNQIRHGGKERF
jgi:hypothetical protein